MNRARLAVVAGLGVTLVTTTGLLWHFWSHSPTYSLRAIARAVEHRDRYEFEKYVDIDNMLQSVVADMAQENGLVSAIGGAMTPQLKATIIKAVEDGTVPPNSRLGDGVQKALAGELPKIERLGRNASFGIPITTNGGAPFTLRIHLTEVPEGHWRIDRVMNLKDLRAREAAEEELRKAAIAKANDEKLGQLRVVAKLQTSIEAGWERKNRFQVRFENGSEKAIAAFTGRIRIPSAEFDHGISGKIEVPAGKTENATWEFDVNRYIPDTVRVYAMGETDRFEVDVDTLTYADGSKVQHGSEP